MKPGEIVAVMGASGSGKSSLLNVLGQRFGLYPKYTLFGSLKANNKIMQKRDFGRFGAFVQQDDILMNCLTVYETLEFACKMRTNLVTKEKIDARV